MHGGPPSYDKWKADRDAGATLWCPMLNIATELSGAVPEKFEAQTYTGSPRRPWPPCNAPDCTCIQLG
jgi:hypothetical protein